MEAKDTVIRDELQNQLDGWLDLVVDVIDAKRKRRINSGEAVLFINWIEDGIALISFKAGIREVVEWMVQHSPTLIAGADVFAESAGHSMKQDISYYPIIKLVDWQAKLEEWGIE